MSITRIILQKKSRKRILACLLAIGALILVFVGCDGAVDTTPPAQSATISNVRVASGSITFDVNNSNTEAVTVTVTVVTDPAPPEMARIVVNNTPRVIASTVITLAASGTKENIRITGLDNGREYTLTLTTADSSGNQQSQKDTKVLTPLAAPNAPTSFTATAGNGEVVLRWTAPADGVAVTQYYIYCATGMGADINTATRLLNTAPAMITDTTYTDSTATNGTQYSYAVRAVNTNGTESTSSNTDTATPLVPPTNLTATARNGQVELNWTAPADGVAVTQYYIYRVEGTDISSATQLTPTTPPTIMTTTYTDSTAVNGTEYSYAVRAVNGETESPDSNTATATPLDAPNAPTSFTATAGNGAVTLRWKAPADGVAVAQYYIYRAEGTDISSATQLTPTTPPTIMTTTYTDSTATSGTQYSYAIRAVNANGTESINSNTTATTPLGPGSRDVASGFNTLATAGNNYPTGIWSDGTTMWVADAVGDKIYAYNLSTKARDAGKDFNTLDAAGNEAPIGIWSDGTTMWVVDNTDKKIYAYTLSTKARDTDKDFNTLRTASNTQPTGIWSDGTTMWVADSGDDKIYAYNLSSKARDAAKDFNTLAAAGNDWPLGIWSDGTTMWVTDEDDNIYAYYTHSGTASNFAYFCPNGTPATGTTPNYYQVNCQMCSSGYVLSNNTCTGDFNTLTAAGNDDPQGIWSDGTTMWVVDNTDDKIYAYNLSTKARDVSKDFDTLAAAYNNDPTGIWSDGTTMWVVDNTDDKIYAYNLSTKARDASKDFDTLSGVFGGAYFRPQGIWSDGATMWVADAGNDKIYAFQLTGKLHDGAKDFNTLTAADNNNPTGIWSDGTTMWVADAGGDKIYAYTLSTKARDASKDFNTLAAAGNGSSRGIWSDGTMMWVADSTDGKIYAYRR